MENRIISNKNAIAGEFNTFFTNIGPNLANEIPQISKTFDQYFFLPLILSLISMSHP